MHPLWIVTAVFLLFGTTAMAWLALMLHRSVDQLRRGVHTYVRVCRDGAQRPDIDQAAHDLRHFTGR